MYLSINFDVKKRMQKKYTLALYFKNACCATNCTSQDIQVCCRCAFLFNCNLILPDLGVLKITLKTIRCVMVCYCTRMPQNARLVNTQDVITLQGFKAQNFCSNKTKCCSLTISSLFFWGGATLILIGARGCSKMVDMGSILIFKAW